MEEIPLSSVLADLAVETYWGEAEQDPLDLAAEREEQEIEDIGLNFAGIRINRKSR